MNGILSPMPVGVLDPRSQAIAQMGMSLLASGGPSRTPVSFGQSLGQAGMQGMQAFQQAQQAQQQEALRQMQMKKLEEEMRIAQQKANEPPRPVVASPGSQFVHPVTGEVMHTVPFKPEPPAEVKPPMTRRVRIGDEDVTQEYVNGKWQEVGRGPAFAPKGATSGPAAMPKPPTGFRYTADGAELEPIPGGPKDTSKKDRARFDAVKSRADIVIGAVDKALSQVGFNTTGLVGSMLGMVPGTDAYDLRKTATTIKANIGFNELQAMREASPTGGALGQVAVQELEALQSVLASIDPDQSAEQLTENLQKVKTHYENWKRAVEQANQGGQQGEPAGGLMPAAAPTQPNVSEAMTKMPSAAKHKGRIIEDDKGKRYKSDGMSWRPL